ncbi:MAG: hypothetical protein WCP10_14930 [Desulfuromonadales bacterium]
MLSAELLLRTIPDRVNGVAAVTFAVALFSAVAASGFEDQPSPTNNPFTQLLSQQLNQKSLPQQQSPLQFPSSTSTAPATGGEAPPIHYQQPAVEKSLPAIFQRQQTKTSDPAPNFDTGSQSVKPRQAGEQAEISPQYVVYRGALERLKRYQGERTLPLLSALISRGSAQHISQLPSAVVSDGKTRVKLIFDTAENEASAPNFAANGASLLSYKKMPDHKGRWVVEVLPERNSLVPSVTVMFENQGFEYTLTVAPQLTESVALDEAGWKVFQQGVASKSDFNRDGVVDVVDEFIFLVNHNVKKGVDGVAKEVKH